MSMSKKVDYDAPIKFKNVSLTMGIQPILKRISFKIFPKTRVAILGIDGGGRSNLFDLLTNVLEKDPNKASEISIFGLSLDNIDEGLIKRQIFLLDKMPVLFEGTIRDNIDPYHQHSDKELIVQLRAFSIESILSKDMASNVRAQGELGSKMVVEPRISIFERLNASVLSPTTPHQFIPEQEYVRSETKKISQ